MMHNKSSVIQTKHHLQNETVSKLRLIQTVDPFQNTDVYSLFLTTESENGCNEEFIYDISRNAQAAKAFFELLCKEKVTALSLREVAEDYLAQL
ncbi:MAG: hypothetical protein IJW87_02780 [Clostridia bacterium]|nr:hypothetical protein [Clostridia bacterium]